MRRAGLRFAPPRLAPEILQDLAWLLARAFGPSLAPASMEKPAETQRAVELARRFGLAARIAARADRAQLAAELGDDAAEALQAERRATAAGNLRLEAAVRAIAAVAAEARIPIGFLKYAALELSGALVPGSRGAADVDVLAPSGREEALRDALAAAGFAICDSPGYEHQLAPQVHPRFGAVEVHRMILGVRLRGPDDRRSATLDALLEAGWTAPCPALPGTVVVPKPEVLAAHAAVHGLGQHGFEPAAYPALRTFADLIDLGWGGPGRSERAALVAPWLAEDLAASEIAALVDLCAELAAGTAQADGDGPSSRLLRHALAGRLDPGYANALKLSLLAPRPSERHPAGRKIAALAAALWPSAAQLDAIYGRPASLWGRLGRRLFRPFDLLRRTARAAASAGEVGRRNRRDDPR